MSQVRKLASDTMIYGVSSILSRLLNYLILTPYLTRVFLEGAYGEISILFTYAGILTVLFTYRMETSFFRFGSRNEEMEKTFSTGSISLLASTLVFSILVLLSLQPLANWLHYPDDPEFILLVLGIIILDTLTALPFARLRLEGRPVRFAALKTAQILLTVLFIFFLLEVLPVLAQKGVGWADYLFDPEMRVGYVFLANLLASGSVLVCFIPKYLKMRWTFDRSLWRQMIRYAMPLVIVGLAAVVNQLIALPLLENLLPGTLEENRAQTGIFSAASKLAILMNLFTQAFNYAAEPFFFHHAARSDSREIYAQTGQAFALVGSFVFLGIMLYLDLIQFFIGAHMRGGLGVVPILLLAYFFLGLYYNFSIWYKLADRTIMGALISMGGVVITLVLNFWLVPIPSIGYYGGAWAALACFGFMAIASFITGRKYFPIPYPIGRMMTYIGVAIALYALSILFGHWPLGVRLLANTALLGVFALIIYRLDGATLRAMISRK
ncbi:MAG: polysaccharide biosynthesis C-terminal domain-containing protein [Saprospirales bacterium]|nr:polysaccharide biosynthesis C-terminal domain-containing protein [Saprospirales bacterium]MBK8490031.1 polysaccharide biosynthesis C-terminal domain-containing protein [Saprospirales bacterium]